MGMDHSAEIHANRIRMVGSSGSPAFWHREYGQPIHTISYNHVTRFEHCSSDNRIVLFTHQIWSITIALLG